MPVVPACAGVAPTSGFIGATISDGQPAPTTGGALVDGTYQLVSATFYGMQTPIPDDAGGSLTVVVAGGTYLRAYSATFFAPFAGSESGTFQLESGSIEPAPTCTDGDPDRDTARFTGAYTAMGNTLVLVQGPPLAIQADRVEYVLERE